ncbi:hypothetical protein KBA39_06885 [Myxococcota bacterium]|nr:hypothetical protein [Myxococcota bacterium]HOD08796.1 hypothetical protein [Myxococcota bacterium]
MATFYYSLQAHFDGKPPAFRNIGVMIWSDNTLNYFAVRGEEEHAEDMNQRIATSLKIGRQISEFVEYFLERHGGFYYSMARPETLQAESPDDVVRQAGQRWELDFVIPPPPPSPIEFGEAKRMMDATEGGCELHIRGTNIDASVHSFAMSFGVLGKWAALGFLPFPYSFSHYARGKIWVDSLQPIDGGWLIRGRENWRVEWGTVEVEIRPLDDYALKYQIAVFLNSLTDDERTLIRERLNYLRSPELM